MRNATLSLLTACALLRAGASLAQTPHAVDRGLLVAAARGDFGPVTVKLRDLPDDVIAVQFTLNGLSGLQDLYTGGFGSSHAGDAAQRLAEYFACYWTNDKIVRWMDAEYVVAYRADPTVRPNSMPGDPALSAAAPGFDQTLRLRLINSNQIVSTTPRPDLTKAGWVKLIAEIAAPSKVGGGRRDIAVMNMKQLALGAIMYSNDSDDLLPNAHSAVEAKAAILPYLKNSELFVSQNPNRGQILYNVNLAAISAVRVPRPTLTPLFYDGLAWPDGGRPVAFLDGHAMYVSANAWPPVAAELARKYKRPPPAPPAKVGKKRH